MLPHPTTFEKVSLFIIAIVILCMIGLLVGVMFDSWVHVFR